MLPRSSCRDDDDLRTQLRAHITALMPAELILPRGRLSAVTHKLLRASLRSPRINELAPGKGGFWDAEQAFEEICAARCSTLSGWLPRPTSEAGRSLTVLRCLRRATQHESSLCLAPGTLCALQSLVAAAQLQKWSMSGTPAPGQRCCR